MHWENIFSKNIYFSLINYHWKNNEEWWECLEFGKYFPSEREVIFPTIIIFFKKNLSQKIYFILSKLNKHKKFSKKLIKRPK